MGDTERVHPDEPKEDHAKDAMLPSSQIDTSKHHPPPGWHNHRRLDHIAQLSAVALTLNRWAKLCHEASLYAGWWHNPDGSWKERNVGEMMMLMVTELSEAFFDFAGRYHMDLDSAIREKIEFNRNREDHKPEHRATEHGKKW